MWRWTATQVGRAGFAFVETMTDEGAKASIEKLSGRMMQGRSIIIEEAQAKPRVERLDRAVPLGPRGGSAARRGGGGGFGPPRAPGAPVGPGAAPVVRLGSAAVLALLALPGRAGRRVLEASGPRGPGGAGAGGGSFDPRRPAGRHALPEMPRGVNVPRKRSRRVPRRKSGSAATGAGTGKSTRIEDGRVTARGPIIQ